MYYILIVDVLGIPTPSSRCPNTASTQLPRDSSSKAAAMLLQCSCTARLAVTPPPSSFTQSLTQPKRHTSGPSCHCQRFFLQGGQRAWWGQVGGKTRWGWRALVGWGRAGRLVGRLVIVCLLVGTVIMNKFFLPTSRNVLPTFQSFCPDGVHFAQTVVLFAHFQNQARKRDVLGWGWGCFVFIHIPERV